MLRKPVSTEVKVRIPVVPPSPQMTPVIAARHVTSVTCRCIIRAESSMPPGLSLSQVRDVYFESTMNLASASNVLTSVSALYCGRALYMYMQCVRHSVPDALHAMTEAKPFDVCKVPRQHCSNHKHFFERITNISECLCWLALSRILAIASTVHVQFIVSAEDNITQ